MQSRQCNLQVLHIGRGALIEDHEVNGELFHAPVLVGLQQLTRDGDVFYVGNPQQDDGQVAGNALAPERRGATAAATDGIRRRTQ